MTEKYSYLGICEFDVHDGDTLIKTVKAKNILTLGGQYILLHAISNSAYSYINECAIGVGTAQPAITNNISTIVNPFYSGIDLVPPTLSTVPSQVLRIRWNLPIVAYNGNTISEIALTARDDNNNRILFNRILLDEVDYTYKTPSIALTGIWYITVTESIYA